MSMSFSNKDKREQSYNNTLGRPRIIQIWTITIIFNLLFVLIVCIFLAKFYDRQKNCVCKYF